MTEEPREPFRPLSVETDDDAALYDALHEGVPPWMETRYWRWVTFALTDFRPSINYTTTVDEHLRVAAFEFLTVKLRLKGLDVLDRVGRDYPDRVRDDAIQYLRAQAKPLDVADALLALDLLDDEASEVPLIDHLEDFLASCNSAWRVGKQGGRTRLVRRVPEGVQTAADATMRDAGRAGERLAEAWGELYGRDQDPTAAYAAAVKAVEDAAIPLVCPRNKIATLGNVIADIEQQRDWSLPMDKEHSKAVPIDLVVGQLRMLYYGQHDRHGGQAFAPGNVSIAEATVAVHTAATLVALFHAGLVRRAT